MSNFYEEMTARNVGIISLKEQKILLDACVGIAGCGGIGGLCAIQFVRIGFGRVKIADFDTFEKTNIGRQACSTSSTIGTLKSNTLAHYLKEINPEVKIDNFSEGIQPENVDEFVNKTNIIIDGIDVSCFDKSLMLYRASVDTGICFISAQAVAFGASVLVFGPNTIDLERFLGVGSVAKDDDKLDVKIPIKKYCPYMPGYVDRNILRDVENGEISPPNIVTSLHLATSIAVSESTLIILNRVSPPQGPNPRVIYMDIQSRKFGTIG